MLGVQKKKRTKAKRYYHIIWITEKVIYTDETLSHLIFAVNALLPKDQNRAIGQNMMDYILNENDAEDVSIPLKYLHLELTLKKLTESKRVAISFEKVLFMLLATLTTTKQ